MTLNFFIEKWILETLSIPNEAFNNVPICPFAKQAWISRKVLVVDTLPQNIKELLQTYEVVIYALNPKDITAEDLSNLAISLSDDSIVALDDHPDYEEKVDNVILNNGKYALLLIQEREKLEHARKILKAKGYYSNWDSEYLEEVLGV